MKDVGDVLYQCVNKVFELDPNVKDLGLLLLAEPNLPDNVTVETLLNTDVVPSLALERQEHTHAVILKDHKLAIAFWSIPSLYSFAYSRFMTSGDNGDETMNSTRAMLLINADCYTAWNRRKKIIIESGKSAALTEAELSLLNLIGTKHPKSGEMWHHRFWLIKNCILNVNDINTLEILNGEMMFSERMAGLYPRNYYAWTHRNLIIKELAKRGMDDLLFKLIDLELERLFAWTKKNVSDHSCIHYIIYLLRTLQSYILNHDKPSTDASVLELFVTLLKRTVEQLHYCQFMILFYPGHESLWCYRKYLFQFLLDVLTTSHVPTHDTANLSQQFRRYSHSETFGDFLDDITHKCSSLYRSEQPFRVPTLRNELIFAETCILDSEVSDYEKQKHFARTYQVWILEQVLKRLPERFSTSENANFFDLLAVTQILSADDYHSDDSMTKYTSELTTKLSQILHNLSTESLVHKNLWRTKQQQQQKQQLR